MLYFYFIANLDLLDSFISSILFIGISSGSFRGMNMSIFPLAISLAGGGDRQQPISTGIFLEHFTR